MTNLLLFLAIAAGPNSTVLQGDVPYRAIGINYFDCFLRTLENGEDTSYTQGFATLAAKKIPFVRFCATGYWPLEMKLYLESREEYFRRLDAVVECAHQHKIGLVPSLFWNHACVPDLVGEPMDQWANPESKTQAWMREYLSEVVGRYRHHPAIWAWEFGNEYSLQANLPNAAEHRPPVQPTLGTPETRGEHDDLTFPMVRAAFTSFATEIRKYDPDRLIVSGDSFPRLSAWNQEHKGTWDLDTPEQFRDVLARANPDPVNAISLHAYENDDERIADAQTVARQLNKPLFVGEFGTKGDSPEEAAKFRRLLDSIIKNQVPLAAAWVFDYPNQPEFNITAENARAWMLDDIAEANRRLQSPFGGS